MSAEDQAATPKPGDLDFLRASSPLKEDLQAVYAIQQRNRQAVREISTQLEGLQKGVENAINSIEALKQEAGANFVDLETGITKLADSSQATVGDIKGFVKTMETSQGGLRQDFKKSNTVLRAMLNSLMDLSDDLTTFRTMVSEMKTQVGALQTLLPPRQCGLAQFDDLPATIESFQTLIANYEEMFPKLEIIIKERLQEVGYTEHGEKREPVFVIMDKVWKAVVANFFTILGTLVLGGIAWAIQTAAVARSESKNSQVIRKMEDRMAEKEAEMSAIADALNSLRAERGIHQPVVIKKPVKAPVKATPAPAAGK